MFPVIHYLELIAIDILGPLPNMKSDKQYVVIMIERQSALTNATPATRTTATTTATVLLNLWISSYGIPTKLLIANCSHFASTFFKTICVELGRTPLTTTEYQLQFNGQVRLFNACTV